MRRSSLALAAAVLSLSGSSLALRSARAGTAGLSLQCKSRLLAMAAQSPAHAVGETVQLPGGITSIDHTFNLPLNWSDSAEKRTVQVFARELYTRGGEQRPCLLFLQGGPGFPSQRTMGKLCFALLCFACRCNKPKICSTSSCGHAALVDAIN
jgi:hypothetical protein